LKNKALITVPVLPVKAKRRLYKFPTFGRINRSNFVSGAGRLRNARVSAFDQYTAGGAGAAPARILDLLRISIMTFVSSIAIDGPASSGKSTVGNLLAQKLSYLYFDTGVMYRVVTLIALQRGIPIEDEPTVTQLAETIQIDVVAPTVADGRQYTVLANGVDVTWAIRTPDVDRFVSPVSAYPGVRRALTQQQRRIGLAGRVVMVGRDIGTVVLPEAELKIYLDASVQERARRRTQECLLRGEAAVYEQILESMQRRDQIDSQRAHAPLRVAADAIRVDSTGKSLEQVMEIIFGLVKQ
jgi:cytidylate kinase